MALHEEQPNIDLEFLLRATEKSQSSDCNDFPDLIQLQAMLGKEPIGSNEKWMDSSNAAESEKVSAEAFEIPDDAREYSRFIPNTAASDSVFENFASAVTGVADEKAGIADDTAPLPQPDDAPSSPVVAAGADDADQQNAAISSLFELRELDDDDLLAKLKSVELLEKPHPGGGQDQGALTDTAPGNPASKELGWTQNPPQPEQPHTAQDGGFFSGLVATFRNQSLVGIDIGSNAIKYVILNKNSNKMQMTAFGCEPLPTPESDATESERRDQLLKFAAKILDSKIKKTDWITSCIYGLEVIYRLLRIPKMAKKELVEAIPWAVRKDLPYEIESATVDFELIGTTKEGSIEKLEVATLVAPTETIARHLGIFQRLNVTPAKITSTPVAIWNVVSRHKAFLSERVLAIEIGATTSHLVFINRGKLDFHREITSAGNDFIEAIAGAIPTGRDGELADSRHRREQAMQILGEYGISNETTEDATTHGLPLQEISVHVRPILERLTSEISRSVDYYREKFRADQIDRVLLSGGGACIKNIELVISDALGNKVEILNPLALAGVRKTKDAGWLETNSPRLTVALGLALDRLTGLNLLPKSLKGAHRIRKAKKFLRYISLGVFLVFLLSTGYVSLKLRQFTADFRRLQEEYKMLEPRRREFLTLQVETDRMKLKQRTYSSKILINTTAENHLRAVSNLVPSTLALTSLTIEPLVVATQEAENVPPDGEQVILRGIAFPDRAMEGANLAAFLLDLERSGYFQAVELVGKDSKADGTITFVVKCIY